MKDIHASAQGVAAHELAQLGEQKYFTALPDPLRRWVMRQPITPNGKLLLIEYLGLFFRHRETYNALPACKMTVGQAADWLSVSEDTIHALNRQLVKGGLIQRIRQKSAGGPDGVAITVIHIPAEAFKEMMASPSRRPVGARTGESTSRPSVPPSSESDETSSGQNATVTMRSMSRAEAIDAVVRLDQEIAELRQRIQRPGVDDIAKIHALEVHRMELIQQYGLRKKSGKNEALQQPPAPTSAGQERKKGVYKMEKRRLTETDVRLIESRVREMKDVSSPVQLVKEIVFSLAIGTFRNRTIQHGLACIQKLIRSGAWRTPWHYSESLIAQECHVMDVRFARGG